ncbi:cysteine sulfinic acid decarboxylase-like [Hydractinia symbiolongicarpus]|uniref:cysteine sulfinic acid decarboxylase-like n=1 Tax=Hydractinia symbiolongicarpus TaxID=13093 RepID=UPI00254FDBA6|nr:cysteine sulfinic acid decarboxylase-like [Hydractinia symbiolongicarpus]
MDSFKDKTNTTQQAIDIITQYPEIWNGYGKVRIIKDSGKENVVIKKSAAPDLLTKQIRKQATIHHQKSLKDLTYKDLFPYAKDEKVTEEVIARIVSKLCDFIKASNDRKTPVINYVSPDDLQKEIDFTLNDNGTSLQHMLNVADKILQHSVKTGHPRFYNQLFSGLDMTCLMGQWISTTTNTLMFTYEVGPVYIMMEKYVLDKMREYIGFHNGDGQIFPGGSISNMQAMSIARFKYFPDLKEEGLQAGPKLVAFVSEEAHYSTNKAAATLGIGTKNLKKITTDKNGKMMVSDLIDQIEAAIARGEKPFYVCATAGTTVKGVFDPINDIADVCEKYDMWLHVDGAWGGASLLSRTYKHLLAGVERANSMTWNPHKLMGCLFQCSMLFTRDKDILTKCNRESVQGASYLFQKDKRLYNSREWDQGDKTIQCGRNVDILKLWMMWKAKGNRGMEEQIDRAYDNSRYLAKKIREREGFELIQEPECTNVCFNYVPPSIRAMPHGPERDALQHNIPPIIKERMTRNGSMMIGYQPLKQHVNFWRMTVINPAVTYKDMEFVVDEIERLGKDL